MQIEVKAFATFRDKMDKQLTVKIEDGTDIRGLLDYLTNRFNGLGKELFESPGILFRHVNILRNGRNIEFINGLDTVIEDGDVIALFPPVGGG